ncbi:MAG: hypothetical protein K6C32_01985, partial [Bacilli bacterium]|nr:hypothetical protein [Bacilli bacterium]
FSIQPVSSATISPFDYKKNKYELGPFAAKLSGIYITECKETFKFANYVDYFLNDVYFKIDLDQFNFTFSNNYKNYQFSYKEAYMVINGKKDFFPHLTYNSKEETRIPLKLNKNGVSISLNYKNTMYVHPTLLHMSLSPKEGLVATNNFYLPINHLEDIYGTTISFVLSEVGYSKTTITFNVTYLAGDYKLGKCANSEYCVVGGIKG